MCVLNTPGFNRVAIAYSTLEYARIFMLLRSARSGWQQLNWSTACWVQRFSKEPKLRVKTEIIKRGEQKKLDIVS